MDPHRTKGYKTLTTANVCENPSEYEITTIICLTYKYEIVK